MSKISVRTLSSSRQSSSISEENFKIRKLEDILAGKDLNHNLHRHEYFFLLVIRKGRGSHQIDFIDYELNDQSVFFLRPGQVHQLTLKSGSEGYLVEFDT